MSIAAEERRTGKTQCRGRIWQGDQTGVMSVIVILQKTDGWKIWNVGIQETIKRIKAR